MTKRPALGFAELSATLLPGSPAGITFSLKRDRWLKTTTDPKGPPRPESYVLSVNQGGTQNNVDSNYMYIGGGRSIMVAGSPPAGEAGANPYTAGIEILGAGNGASRDAGAGPAFTGFAMKMVTAAGDAIDNGDVVETGWTNRSGETINTDDSVFGSDVTASAIPFGMALTTQVVTYR